VQLIAPSWPLQRLDIDIVNKLTPTLGYYTFAVVAVEYFTKWVEAKPLTNVSSTSIKKFFWQNIICHYGVPWHITVDNAKYFDNAIFKDIYHKTGTKVAFASVYHPQSNRAVERANGLIFEAIKKTLEGEKKGSLEEVMPQAVWCHNTTVCRVLGAQAKGLMPKASSVLPRALSSAIFERT
jgi:hypothetical protein